MILLTLRNDRVPARSKTGQAHFLLFFLKKC